jgi:hypothetical protein
VAVLGRLREVATRHENGTRTTPGPVSPSLSGLAVCTGTGRSSPYIPPLRYPSTPLSLRGEQPPSAQASTSKTILPYVSVSDSNGLRPRAARVRAAVMTNTSRTLWFKVAAFGTRLFDLLYSVNRAAALMRRGNTRRTLEGCSALLEDELHVCRLGQPSPIQPQNATNNFGILLEADA